MFPTDSNASREALRRTLNQSLTEVLGDVGFDNNGPSGGANTHQQAQQQAQLASLQQAQQASRTPSSFLGGAAHHQQPQASPLAHSLGFASMPVGPSPSAAAGPGGLNLNLNDALLASVAQQQQGQAQGGGGGSNDAFLGQARAAIMQQRIVELEKKRQLLLEENKRRILEDSYMALLRSGALGADKMAQASALGAMGGSSMGGMGGMAPGMMGGAAGMMGGMGLAGLAGCIDPSQGQLPLTALASHITGQQQQQQQGPGGEAGASVRQVVQQQQLQQGLSVAAVPSQAAPKMANPLQALGSSLRNRDDPYIDVSSLPVPQGPLGAATTDSSLRRTRGGVAEPFPERLYRMLDESSSKDGDKKDGDAAKEDHSDIVSFYSHGRAFGVHDPDRFVAEVMPKYFKQSKWNSFARQLNLYGFVRITSGADAGGYYHELFLRGRPDLTLHMRRVGVPHQGADRRKIKYKNATGASGAHGAGNHSDPDFYSMKPIVIPEALLNKKKEAAAAAKPSPAAADAAAAPAEDTEAPEVEDSKEAAEETSVKADPEAEDDE